MEKTFEFRDYLVNIKKESLGTDPTNRDYEISITLTLNGNYCFLLLSPLWNIPFDLDENIHYDYKDRFSEGDYFQQTISSKPQGMGLGSAMHDFLLCHLVKLEIQNIYSTNDEEDGFLINDGAKGLWDKSVKRGIAIFDAELNRYKLEKPG